MSSVIFFCGAVGIVICLVGMLLQSRGITEGSRDIRKMFYYYMGMSVFVCVASVAVQVLWYIALGLGLLGIGITMYIWKLNKEFKRLEKLDKAAKFIESNPELFEEDKERLKKLKIQLIELQITITSQSNDLIEKAVDLDKE